MNFEQDRITFPEADRRYAELKRQLDAGAITDEEFDAKRNELMVQDDEDRWWAKSRSTGEWLYHDGTAWVTGTPPGDQSSLANTAPDHPERVGSSTETVSTEKEKRSLFDLIDLLSTTRFLGVVLACAIPLALALGWSLSLFSIETQVGAYTFGIIATVILYSFAYCAALRARSWHLGLTYALVSNVLATVSQYIGIGLATGHFLYFKVWGEAPLRALAYYILAGILGVAAFEVRRRFGAKPRAFLVAVSIGIILIVTCTYFVFYILMRAA